MAGFVKATEATDKGSFSEFIAHLVGNSWNKVFLVESNGLRSSKIFHSKGVTEPFRAENCVMSTDIQIVSVICPGAQITKLTHWRPSQPTGNTLHIISSNCSSVLNL